MNNEYTPGMRVIIRDEEWMVKKVTDNTLGNKALHCVGVSPLVHDRESIFLTDLEVDDKGNSLIQIVDPAKVKLTADTSPFYKKTRLYIESQWRQQIPTDDKIHIGYKAAMDSMKYQLLPAQTALKKLRARILIADAVGLGKTLEAGILMSELIARGKGKRILVVTSSSMMQQFQKEMWNRFTIPLVRLDSKRIQKIKAELPSNYNPFFYYDKTIISIDTLKRDVEYRTHLEQAYWDIIVIDEAQNVATRNNGESQRARLAQLLAKKSDSLILLSATPHDGSSKSFASLINMLDPTAISNPNDYTADDIQGLFVRRFKKDISQGSFLERKISIERCHASFEEERALDLLADMKLDMDRSKKRSTGMLFKTTLKKAFFSSPAACIQTIDERLKKLKKKYNDDEIEDIHKLEELKDSLELIPHEEFTRYQKLLELLNSKEYGWDRNAKDDRIVIFTERIATMEYIAEHLRKDLHMNDKSVVDISGHMSDVDLQKVVDDFGRDESPIRILVASDVASEGLNLHYLSHRLIHFDIPWSLMVFQQRNGRIDRYGQKKQPDIRFMEIESDNKKIKGDMRILEILIEKEKQAHDNIGDPSVLMGKFNIEDEENEIAEVIENGSDSAAFENKLDQAEKSTSFLDSMLKRVNEKQNIDTVDDKTMFKDIDYVSDALEYLNTDSTEKHPVERMKTVSGIEIKMTKDLNRRLKAVMPAEALPEAGHTIKLSDDKEFCMQDMKLALQNDLDQETWPTTQYLWKLHPIMGWINDKVGLLVKRNEALVMIGPKLQNGMSLFIVNGSMPNERSTPLIDNWFGVLYKNNEYVQTLTMDEVIELSGINKNDIPNKNNLSEDMIHSAEMLLPDVIEQSKKYLHKDFYHFQAKNGQLIDKELDKLSDLQKKKRDYQISLFKFSETKQEAAARKVDEIFDSFVDYVNESLTIKDNPYIRIIAVLMGE